MLRDYAAAYCLITTLMMPYAITLRCRQMPPCDAAIAAAATLPPLTMPLAYCRPLIADADVYAAMLLRCDAA